ncbi:GNAT family N-acetyltransferase [Paenibacillus solani]|uniref:GNAT family N-acetyltransferase n=1 Tax=Paenibacillus solani TaxID=1705565 RepID=UPI003D2A9E56
MIRRLRPEELDILLASIKQEQHFLYYSYLTYRRHGSVHYGQFLESGELLGVLAYLKGLPFHAFSVYPLQPQFQLGSVLAHIKQELNLPRSTEGSFIVHADEWKVLSPEVDVIKPPTEIWLMKHVNSESLPLTAEEVILLGPAHFDRIEDKLADIQAMAFAKEELQNPFYGVLRNQELVAVGGYHIYGQDYVELGNIGTDRGWRRQGFGKKVCAELTRRARDISPHVYLNVLGSNTAAIQLYQSLGYVTVCKQYMVTFAVSGCK